jgi:predicted heme/steroid binding protein
MEYATLFPLDRICGRWKSRGKSPPVRVYREGRTYRIALAYRWGAVLTATLYRNGQGTWAELPERVQKKTSGSCSPRKGCMYGTAGNMNIDKDILIINGYE